MNYEGKIYGFGEEVIPDQERCLDRNSVAPNIDCEKAGIIRDMDIPYRPHLDKIVFVEIPTLGNFIGVYIGIDSTTHHAALYPYVSQESVRGAEDIIKWRDDLGPMYVPLGNSTFRHINSSEVDTIIANTNEKRVLEKEISKKKGR